ncbi:MAG: TLD domain-containing protein, partial [Terracidiphilus sp.]|nr:TLD domain-containing protein [Terracidiphilus sp.]
MKGLREAAAAAVLADLQRSVASLTGRVASLPRRFGMSHCAFVCEVPLLAGGLAAGREATFDCSVLTSNVAKALEASAEEVHVCAAQLDTYAALLEREAGDGEAAGVEFTARTLLSSVTSSPPPPPSFVALPLNSAALLYVVDATVRVRDGVDPLRCIVSGAGLNMYQAGDVDNLLCVAAVDGEGNVVESLEAEDVTVSMDVHATVTHCAVEDAGIVAIVYRLRNGRMSPVELEVRVCGVVLFGASCVTAMRGGSVILAGVALEQLAAFLHQLCVWLPGPASAHSLLYRGSRDGMNAAAFHRLCDNKGPTLVLVRCDKGYVFGGYTGASWESPPVVMIRCVASPDAFLFSVVGPHCSSPVMFPAVAPIPDEAGG